MHPREPLDVVVVGGGVSGLTTAVVLAESGLRVQVWTRHEVSGTTSAVAGALWEPYLVEPRSRVLAWSARTFHTLAELARAPERTGVRMVTGHKAQRSGVVAPPWWAEALPGVATPVDAALLPGGYLGGHRARLPLVEMAVYLPYLVRRLNEAGGQVRHRPVSRLTDPAGVAPRVVNCTGVSARTLVPDPLVGPVQGQVVVVRNPGVDHWFVEVSDDATESLYVLPHPSTVILGGTADRGRWDTTPSPRTAAAIVARCARVDARLESAEVLDHRVGLRPYRPEVRLEREVLPSGAVCVHNYGHGGAGVTVSWGCAAEAAELLRES